jgi:hypothetical protein
MRTPSRTPRRSLDPHRPEVGLIQFFSTSVIKWQLMSNSKQLVVFFIFLASAAHGLDSQPTANARKYIEGAIVGMGGQAALENLKIVRFAAVGYRDMVEQSERPEGPYVVEYDEISEVRDLEHRRFRRTQIGRVLAFPSPEVTTVVADDIASRRVGKRSTSATRQQIVDAQENLELGPERILLTALAAPDLRADADTILQSVPQHVITFTWKGRPVRIFLNVYTSLPTAVEWTCPYPQDTYWTSWGDVTTRIYYSAWWLVRGGIHYPLQWDSFRNDLPDRVLTIATIEPNVALPPDTFEISADDKAAFAKTADRSLDDRVTSQGGPGQPAIELAKDIILIPGAWNATLIRQSDGVVILEAPISATYSARVIAEANRRWPGVPIKAVISTSDAWPHIAGVREYVARRIPVYALDLNIPILSRLVASPHTIIPDTLAKAPKSPDFRAVSHKTAIGDGSNRIEIYPLRGETSERQMMVYFPSHKLLYGSDPFQKLDDGTYSFPQTVWELVHAVETERLPVDTFFMMHIGPTPWSDLHQAIEKAER